MSTQPQNLQAEKVLLGSPDRFGYEWSSYSTILPEHKLQLERWLGSTGLESFRGKTVLDVGCGMGRNPFWMSRAGASSVIAIDADDRSLEAARRNLAGVDRVQVQKCSVYDLAPDRFGRVDRVTCIGVLHHLGDPREALERMWGCVAPGGDLVLWCYAREGNRLFLPLIQGLRSVGSRLPLPLAHLLARTLALAAWPAFRLLPWRTEYYRNLRKLSFRNVESILFDQILPRTTHYWSRREMEDLMAPLDGQATLEFVQGNSWHVRVAKV
jgi:2-polyprenyl-3-methyl-5-hydroxy-6-metoxy-1,4-benzoquinol methylase